MPDDDDKKKRAFEEARREFDNDPEFEDDAEPARPRLRIVDHVPEQAAWQETDWLPTGEAVVDEFVKLHGENFYFVDAEAAFYQWTGQVWARDERRMVNRLMAELCCEIGVTKKKSWRAKLEGAAFIDGAARHVRDRTAGPLEKFDAMDVFNSPLGEVPMNCAKWSIEPHKRESFCSRIAMVGPKAGPCPMWLRFLDQITADDHDLRDYLQRVAGYCASPFTTEQAFFFFFGSGGNGKGTFLRVLKKLLGSYATTASLDLFLATKFEAHPEELAALRAMRLVIATETEAGRSWNESKIKALTGGDPIRARFMRQNSFEYDPQFKIIVSGNHQPAIKNVDPAMRRRLQLVPFNVQIPASQQDGSLERRLITQEGPQILAWVFEGFNQWREHGLAPPDKVIASSEAYFEEQDLMAQWIGECCETAPDFFDFTMTLFKSWKAFAEKAGEKYIRLRSFVTELKNRGYPHNHQMHGNGFGGIKVRSMYHDDD